MQENSQIPTTPPLPGIVAIPAINKALQTIATDFSGPNDPAASAWPYSCWADTVNNVLKRRTAANTGWVIEADLFKRAYTTSGGGIDGQVAVYKDAQASYVDAALVSSTKSSTAGDAAIGIVVNGVGGVQLVVERGDTATVKVKDETGTQLKRLTVKDAVEVSDAATKGQLDNGLFGKQAKGNYVSMTNATPVSVTWDGSQFQAAGAGTYRGALWHSGNFDPSTKATKGSLVQHEGAIVEIGPVVFVQDVNPNQVDFPNPYVMVGMRRLATTATVYLRGIALRMI